MDCVIQGNGFAILVIFLKQGDVGLLFKTNLVKEDKMKRNRRSFKKELILSFLVIGLTSILLLGSFQVFQLSSLIKENQKNQLTSTIFLEDHIGNYIKTHKQLIQTMSQHIAPLFAEGEYEDIKQKLREIKANYPGFVNLYVGDKNGQSILFYPDVYTDGVKREHHNFSDRKYYKELIETEATVISSVLHGRFGTDVLLVTIVSPIFDKAGNMQGYILGALDLNVLDKYVSSRITGKESTAVVLDKEHNVVVHPEIDTRRELVNLADSHIVKQISQGGTIGSFKLATEEQYVTYANIEGLEWIVWVTNPLTAITDTFRKAIITIFIFAMITGTITVLVSLALTNRLDKTILKLLDYIKRYTEGYKKNQSIPLTEKIQGPTEMNQLLVHFNDMMQEIEHNRVELVELNTKLEARVQERTANLESKNLKLRAVNKLITSVSTQKDLPQFIQHCLLNVQKYTSYETHILMKGFAITATAIRTYENMEDYIEQHVLSDRPHMEPIHVDVGVEGILMIDLLEGQPLEPGDREFIQTFSRSLAIMLQNKLLFEQFRNKHAELDAVLESMFEGIMLLNNQNQIKYANEFFRHVISYASEGQESTTLKTLADVYHHLHTSFQVGADELSAFFETDAGGLKLAYPLASGKKKVYLLHKFSVVSDTERIGSGLLLRDITKEEEIDTLKNNLISLTSHEFKTPITNIKGSVETLLRKDVEWEQEFQLELLEGVLEDTDRIVHLVNDWMDISKIESGTMYIDRHTVRVDHVIEEALASVPQALQENAIFKFHQEAGKDVFFYADKRRVQQVLLNLFTNALRYNDEAIKRIDITLKEVPGYITITVSDNGIGISQKHVRKIFNRFYQVDVTATRRSGGTGLGLAICEGIMEAHGGKIEVKSNPGEGSTFILYFPIVTEED